MSSTKKKTAGVFISRIRTQEFFHTQFNQSIQRCWANLFVTANYFETGKLCSLRTCHSHSADSVKEKSVSESGHAVLSNV